jgi:hypothetical protein
MKAKKEIKVFIAEAATYTSALRCVGWGRDEPSTHIPLCNVSFVSITVPQVKNIIFFL